MKTKLILLSLLSVFLFGNNYSAHAQNDNKKDRRARREKLDSLKIKYFNNSLSLTEVEQKNFWPLYNEYQKKLRKLKKDFKQKYKKNDIIYMDDKGAELYLNDLNTLKENELKVFKEYQSKFKAILPTKKVLMIYRTENEWQIKLRGFIREKYKQGKERMKQNK